MSRKIYGESASAFSLFAFQDIITSVTGIMLFVVLLMAVNLAVQRLRSSDFSETQSECLAAMQVQLAALHAEIDDRRQWIAGSRERLKEFDGIDPQRLPVIIGRSRRAVEALDEKRQRDVRRRDEIVVENRRLVKALDELAAKQGELAAVQAGLEDAAETSRDEIERLRGQLQDRWQQADSLVRLRIRGGDGKFPIVVQCSDAEIRVKTAGTGEPITFTGAGPDIRQMGDAFGKWAAGRNAAREYFVVLLKPSAAGMYSTMAGILRQHGFQFGFEPLSENLDVIQ